MSTCFYIPYKSPNLTWFVKATEDGLRWPKPNPTLRQRLSAGHPIFASPAWDLRCTTSSLSYPHLSAWGPTWSLSTVMIDKRGQEMEPSPYQPVQWPIYIAHGDLRVSRHNDGKMIKTTQLKSFAEWQVSRILAAGSQRSSYFILTLSYMRWNWLGAQD